MPYDAIVLQPRCRHFLLTTSIMPGSACWAQNCFVLVPSTPYDGNVAIIVAAPLVIDATMPSFLCPEQTSAFFVPSTPCVGLVVQPRCSHDGRLLLTAGAGCRNRTHAVERVPRCESRFAVSCRVKQRDLYHEQDHTIPTGCFSVIVCCLLRSLARGTQLCGDPPALVTTCCTEVEVRTLHNTDTAASQT